MSDEAADTLPTGSVLREPGPLAGTGIGEYRDWLAAERGLEFADYDALWRWSVEDLEGFWGAVWDHFGVRGGYDRVLGDRAMPGAQWFPGAQLNYAEHMLDHPGSDDELAVVARSQTRGPVDLTFGELRDRVARARAGLTRLGVGRGDRVAAFLPNVPEALVAFLACASLGAVWASCAPEFGARSVIDRFAQIEPTVLLVVSGYRYGSKDVDRGPRRRTCGGLPTVRHVVGVDYGDHVVDGADLSWDELLAASGPLEFERLPFDHPLYVLFSSGTTGLPKAIVHSHGGILLEHLKSHAFQLDTLPGDRPCGSPRRRGSCGTSSSPRCCAAPRSSSSTATHCTPDLGVQWRIAAETGATLLGTSPAYLMACREQGVRPGDEGDLAALRMLGITGAPLPGEGFDWAVEELGAGVLVNSMSGGTDVCSGFVAGSPWLPVYRGELSGPCLGVDATAFDADGREVVGELGELVIRQPMPSMPVRFWGDDDGSRYRDSYFDVFPGVWRHGDWVTRSERRSFVISGRSDATLNRGGVRLGTAEFYAVVEELPEVADSLVVHLEDDRGGAGRLLLFVAPAEGVAVDDALRDRIRAALRRDLSPRHLPDLIAEVPAVPRTLTGKKLESPDQAGAARPGAVGGHQRRRRDRRRRRARVRPGRRTRPLVPSRCARG